MKTPKKQEKKTAQEWKDDFNKAVAGATWPVWIMPMHILEKAVEMDYPLWELVGSWAVSEYVPADAVYKTNPSPCKTQ